MPWDSAWQRLNRQGGTGPSSAKPLTAALTPKELGSEIRRTAERAARAGRAEAQRQHAAVDLKAAAEEKRRKLARKKRLFAALLGAFLLLSALNISGLGFYRSPRPAAWSEESLDRYLREELLFEVESIEFFSREQGRVPQNLGEMGYPSRGDLSYERLGEDEFRITISESGASLTYESQMHPSQALGERIDD